MRRPDPLPTPPRREPEPQPEAASAAPAGGWRERRATQREQRSADRESSSLPQDDIATDVDLVTLDERSPAHERTVSNAGDAAVTDADSVDPGAAAAGGAEHDANGQTPAESVRRRDVWRAARAHRRAVRQETKRFTARLRRRRWMWLGGAAAVAAVGAGSFAIAYSPLLAVREITIVGNDAIPEDRLQQALEDQLGTPLAAVDDSAVKAALVAFPMIETYALTAKPPHELELRIVERTPVGVVASDAGFSLVDAAGVVLSTTAEKPKGQPEITVADGLDSRSFQAAGQVLRTLPDDVLERVTEVTADSPNNVVLTLGETSTQVVWGGAEHSQEKSLNLEAAMQVNKPADIAVYDVSSVSSVVMR